MTDLKVLVSGAGIGGPVFAYFLKRGLPSAQITVIERAPEMRTTGQNIDIRGPGVDMIKYMNIYDKVKGKHTTEEGIAFVDENGREIAGMAASGDDERQYFTSEFEILRGELAKICYEESVDDAEYVFGEYLKSVKELASGKVEVEFANGREAGVYDLVVGADGMVSNTRRLVFGKGPGGKDYLHSLGQYGAYFTIPRIETDTKWAQWYNTTKGRLMFTRPDNQGTTRAYLGMTNGDPKELQAYEDAFRKGPTAQKKVLREDFSDAQWQSKRILEGMETADDFYFQLIAQVKMPEYVKGSVALLGDAGYCPSPLSGMGTTTAMVAAYILAGEISESPQDIPKALLNYQTSLNPFIKEVQWLLPGVPHIMIPQTSVGIWIQRTIVSFLFMPWIVSFFGTLAPAFGAFSNKKWMPKRYAKLHPEGEK